MSPGQARAAAGNQRVKGNFMPPYGFVQVKTVRQLAYFIEFVAAVCAAECVQALACMAIRRWLTPLHRIFAMAGKTFADLL